MNNNTKIKKIKRVITRYSYYIRGRIIARRLYDEKYLATKYFEKWSSPGWEWAVHDNWGRRHYDQNRDVPWPVFPNAFVPHPENVIFDPSSLNIFHTSGVYFQGIGGAKTIIGKNCWVAQNVGFITSNHDPTDPSRHLPAKGIKLGDECWIGMNSVILPGVELGNHTVVGAGSIVTKSFPEGHCVIAGNPAKLIRKLDTEG